MPIEFPPAIPEIPVSNIDAAAAYYQTGLGFHLDWGDDAGGIAGISQGESCIFLTNTAFRQGSPVKGPIVIWFNLNNREQVDALHAQWSANGARIVSPPESKPWNLHEFTATDLDGNLFRVFYDFAWELRESSEPA
jgi:uncharacterized glyoxalase superfamily protein PhnB